MDEQQSELWNEKDFLPDDQQENLDDDRDDLDTSDVVLYSTDWTVESVIKQIEKKRIDLNPAFQRRQAWSVAHRSKFIESLLLSIPIPQIVLAEDPNKKGHYIVIDGKQRLLALSQFVQDENDNNRFERYKLRSLSSALKKSAQIKGKFFHELDEEEQSIIENSVLRTVIIRSVNNDKFLYEAFLRLNQGSKALSSQELRQALSPGHFTNWLENYVCTSETVQRALRISDPDPRMRDTEVVLRFMAFRDGLDGYNGKFKELLDNFMIKMNAQYSSEIDASIVLSGELERAINTTMIIFGDNAFEKFDAERDAFTGKFNRAIFDSMTFFFADKNVSDLAVEKHAVVKKAFIKLCSESPTYLSAVESSFKDVRQTYNRLYLWREKLAEVLNIELIEIKIEDNKIRVG